MTILHKITWKEFEKIGQVLKDYQSLTAQLKQDEWFEHMHNIFFDVKKQPYNIDVLGLEKEDFKRMAIIVDMWNVVKSPIGAADNVSYDSECDAISSKLQRAYFKEFNENLFSE